MLLFYEKKIENHFFLTKNFIYLLNLKSYLKFFETFDLNFMERKLITKNNYKLILLLEAILVGEIGSNLIFFHVFNDQPHKTLGN